MRRAPPGVYDPLGYPLVVEVVDLLPQQKIFEQGTPPNARLKGVVGVVDFDARVRGQGLAGSVGSVLIQVPVLLVRGAGSVMSTHS